jgi:hypothetical protein
MTSWVAGLLAGLILAGHVGAPPAGRGIARAAEWIGAKDADPADPDAETDGDEVPTSEVDPLHFAQGRSPRLSPSRGHRRTGFLLAPSVLSGSATRRSGRAFNAHGGEPPGHFLAEGRPFRYWIQSLTC